MQANYKYKYAVVQDLYDTYVNADYDIKFWVSECKKSKEVLELTAGTGRVTIPLAKAGIEVTALDISKEVLTHLKAKAKRAKVKIKTIEADMRSFDLKRKFPLIIIPFQSIQELTSDHEACLRQVKKHLEDNGRFIVTMHNENRENRIAGKYVLPKSRKKILFSTKRTYNQKTQLGTAFQTYEEYDKKGNLISKKQFKNSYYVFRKGEFEALAKKCGFRIKNLYGDYSRREFEANSPFRIYELTKC